uniref:inositol monophosphatase family protein n=1 Tax=Desertihabitans aurantiacus TaxID=2282477 RepID=UPI000DF82293
MDTDEVLQLIHRVAETVVTPRWRALGEAEVSEKGPGDYVTVADHEAEVALTEALSRAHPGALVVGEEAVSADASVLDGLAEAEQAWVIDPIDGTGNFVRGSADHAVMVAELRRGEAVRGWIHQPQHQRSFVAERGAGVTVDGTPLAPRTVGGDPAGWRGVSSRRRWRDGEFPPLGRIGDTWW